MVESHRFPKLYNLAKQQGYDEIIIDSSRKALSQLKKNPPDVVIAEYRYSFSNNYSGIATSNLDIFLRSLHKFAPSAKVIVLADKEDIDRTANLKDIYPLTVMSLVTPAKDIMQSIVG
jgi:DNA-binding NarL/FixJ family response regulator